MSGTITGSRTGSYGPRIVIEWKVLEQDIAGNRSKIEAISYMNVASTISYSGRHNVNINISGNSVNKTAKSASSSAWTRELNRHTAWINHSSDGTKNVTISSSYNVQVTWKGQWISKISASATVTLDSIPRASTINSASFPYALQAPKGKASENSISLSLSKKLSSYTHYIKLEHGNTFIGEWNNQSNPTSLELNTTHVERIFKALPNSTTGTFKLTVTTKNGSSNIGSASTNITANLHSNSGPYFTSNTIGIAGSGKDKSWGVYIQSISKASITSKASAGLGATLRSISISQGSSVVGSSTGADVSVTSPTLTSSGDVTFKYTVTDSRGNTTPETKTIKVLPYVNPSVNTFSAQRNATTNTTANISYNVSYSPVNGKNKLTIVSKYTGTATGTPVNKVFAGTGTARATDSSSYSVTNLNKFGNFDFSIEITDSLGNKSSNVYSMTSSALPLSLDKNNKGIGVGKDYTKGALDVGGDAYIDGKLYVNGVENGFKMLSSAREDLNKLVDTGAYRLGNGHPNAPSGHEWSQMLTVNGGGDTVSQMIFNYRAERVQVRSGNPPQVGGKGSWNPWKEIPYMEDVEITRGSNDNGEWVRFPDGTQIAWKEIYRVENFVSGKVLSGVWTLPVTFTSIRPTCFLEKDAYSGSNAVNKATTGSLVEPNSAGNYTTANLYIYFGDDSQAKKGFSVGVRVMVIGRWK